MSVMYVHTQKKKLGNCLLHAPLKSAAGPSSLRMVRKQLPMSPYFSCGWLMCGVVWFCSVGFSPPCTLARPIGRPSDRRTQTPTTHTKNQIISITTPAKKTDTTTTTTVIMSSCPPPSPQPAKPCNATHLAPRQLQPRLDHVRRGGGPRAQGPRDPARAEQGADAVVGMGREEGRGG